jgi:hypothetical protein
VPALNVALLDVREENCRVFEEACVAAGYSPIFKALCDGATDALSRWADLVVIEGDLCFRALHLAEKARRCGRCPVGVLVNWWSDLERDAHDAADFVLHVPLTAAEVRHVLAAVPQRPSPSDRRADEPQGSSCTKVREAIKRTEESENWGSNDLLMSDVLRRNELQAWFVSAQLVDLPLAGDA